MPTAHRNLTGSELHEPKGIETAAAGEVYVANGTGSGTWDDQYGGHLIRNKYWLNGEINDVSTPGDKYRFYIPVESEIVELAAITESPLTTANATLSIYINNVLFTDSLTVTQAGSVIGTLHKVLTTTAHTVPANSVVEIRTDGASDTASFTYVTLGLRAK